MTVEEKTHKVCLQEDFAFLIKKNQTVNSEITLGKIKTPSIH